VMVVASLRLYEGLGCVRPLIYHLTSTVASWVGRRRDMCVSLVTYSQAGSYICPLR
jgi:hypothetical protein